MEEVAFNLNLNDGVNLGKFELRYSIRDGSISLIFDYPSVLNTSSPLS